jgi:uncharacterized LabA/DUF88 family protein
LFPEPDEKRVVAFFDGQNLFHAAKESFGCKYPNYDVSALAQSVSHPRGWRLAQTRFYTGVHDKRRDPFWHGFWNAKLTVIGHQGVSLISRPLRYNQNDITLSDGRTITKFVGSEKGIDIRIALDAIHLAIEGEYEVALIFSQDQDFSELATELQKIAKKQGRWFKVASAYPQSELSIRRRGIDNTDWIPILRQTYERCIDPCTYGYISKKSS